MDFSQTEQAPAKKFTGLAAVVLLHVFIVYALATGLARKVVEVIKQPIETKIIDEIKPPPPPPPDKPAPPPPPKLAAPPPPFIPPPEIQVQQPPPQQNTIAAVSTVKPDNPVLPPPQKQEAAPVPVPAPVQAPAPAAAVHVAPVVDSRACSKPKYPRASELAEETGTVHLQFLVGVDGKVLDAKVEKSSGFKNLDNAARSALSLCKFKPGTSDGKPEQAWAKLQYEWKLE